jgi:hypothetical protein
VKYDDLKNVTRITVILEDGTVFERYGAWSGGIELHLQDDNRTLKIFPRQAEPTDD